MRSPRSQCSDTTRWQHVSLVGKARLFVLALCASLSPSVASHLLPWHCARTPPLPLSSPPLPYTNSPDMQCAAGAVGGCGARFRCRGPSLALRAVSYLFFFFHSYSCHVQSDRPHKASHSGGDSAALAAPTRTLGPLTAPHRTSSYEGPIIPQTHRQTDR